jgi:Ca2+-binding RTX toxin-like protein
MRWHNRLLIVMAVFGALAATAGAALGAAGSGAATQVKGKVDNGTLTVTGTSAADTLALLLDPVNPTNLDVVDGTGTILLSFDRSTFDTIVVNAGGGDDNVRIDQFGGTFTDTEATTLNGQGGNDTLSGGSGPETLDGGAGDDVIDGNFGSDVALGGSGNDTFVWDPGDGSDTIEGQGGKDTMLFNGSNAGEQINLSANGSRLLLHRDVANIDMDVDGVETVDINARGGADTITVGDLSPTDVKDVSTNLAGFDGMGDGAPDSVVADGTDGADRPQVDAGKVTRLGATVEVAPQGVEPNDALVVAGLGGDDELTADPIEPITVKFDGGDGNDTAIDQGTPGDDTFGIASVAPAVAVFGLSGFGVQSIAENLLVQGLDGNDTIRGQNGIGRLTALTLDGGSGDDDLGGGDGNDTLIGGSGDDTFEWDPGDASDTIEGQAGTNTLVFNGSNAAEHIDLSASGHRLLLHRDIANINMDVDGVQSVDVKALGSADTITVGDLTATDVEDVTTDLSSIGGGGDAAADNVIVNGTQRGDVIGASGSAGSAVLTGLAYSVAVAGAEVPSDRLTINALGGNDTVDASGLAPDAVALTIDGGDGDDRLTGGGGDDVLVGGAGNDVLDGGPGNNTLIQ